MVSNKYEENKVNVFVSYSHQDSIVPKIFIKFKDTDKDINFWLDTELQSGDKWDDEIKKKIRDCDYYLLFVSPSMLLSEYIFQKELDIIFQKDYKKELIIFPHIVDFNYGFYSSETTINNLIKKINFVIELSDKYEAKYKSDEKNKRINKYRDNLKNFRDFIQENQVEKKIIPFPHSEETIDNYYDKIITQIRENLVLKYRMLKEGYEIKKHLLFYKPYARRVLEYITDSNGGTYFNSQIALTNWFNPALQLNLSLQKEIEEKIDYKILIHKIKEVKENNCKETLLPLHTKTRISRVFFLPFEKDEIKRWKKFDKAKNEKVRSKWQTRYHNLIALNEIHRMMGSPMAVVGYDQLWNILNKTNSDGVEEFYLTDDELELLGINFKKDEKGNYLSDKQLQKERLKTLIENQIVEDNIIKPSIDFAAFTHHKQDKDFRRRFQTRIDKLMEEMQNCDQRDKVRKKINEKENKLIENIFDYIEKNNKDKTVIIKAGIENDPDKNEKRLLYFNLKEFDKTEFYLIKEKVKYDNEKQMLGKIKINLDKEKFDEDNYFKASQKFGFLVDFFVFERRKTSDFKNELDSLDSNRVICELNGDDSCNHNGYNYKIAKDNYNIEIIYKDTE